MSDSNIKAFITQVVNMHRKLIVNGNTIKFPGEDIYFTETEVVDDERAYPPYQLKLTTRLMENYLEAVGDHLVLKIIQYSKTGRNYFANVITFKNFLDKVHMIGFVNIMDENHTKFFDDLIELKATDAILEDCSVLSVFETNNRETLPDVDMVEITLMLALPQFEIPFLCIDLPATAFVESFYMG